MTTVHPHGIELRECEPADLPLLEAWCPTGRTGVHAQRFARQRTGRSTFYIAHVAGDRTGYVGSCELRWDGCDAVEIPRCPEVNGLHVWPEHLRGRGVGTRILAALEPLVGARGHNVLGLGVGVDNPRAEALYLRCGYADSGLTYLDRYSWVDGDGRVHHVADRCRWLVKALPQGGRRTTGVDG